MTTQENNVTIWDRLATTWNVILTICIAGIAIIAGVSESSFLTAVGVFVVLMIVAVLRGIAFELVILAIASVGALIITLVRGAGRTQ